MGAKTSNREVVRSEMGCSGGNKVAAARLAMNKLVVPAVGPEMISKGRMREWQQWEVKTQEIVLLVPMNSKSHETPALG